MTEEANGEEQAHVLPQPPRPPLASFTGRLLTRSREGLVKKCLQSPSSSVISSVWKNVFGTERENKILKLNLYDIVFLMHLINRSYKRTFHSFFFLHMEYEI